MTDHSYEEHGDSRRTVIRKGVLTATALTVGAGATATSATAVNDELAVLHGRDYYPDTDFDILTQLGTGTRNNFLEEFDDDGIFDDPDDWEVFVIRIDVGEAEGLVGHMMIDVDNDDPDVDPGDSGTMDDTASFRDRERNLIETEVDL